MSELDSAAQLLRVEIDGMKYAFSAAGIAGIGLIKVFAKFIKFLGNEGEKHRFKKLDALAGEASLADFKEKYSGEDVELFELKDYDADAFVDMCKSEGIAVVKLPDLNGDDGKCQFMAAGSAGPMIKHNIERLTQWHMQNKRGAKYLRGEVPGFAFAEYASGRKTKELKALTVRDGHSSAEFIEACRQAGIPVMRDGGSDRKFIVTKEDFKSKAFSKHCSGYADEGYISFTEECRERISNMEFKSGEAINATDYVMSAKGDTAEEKQANFKAMADECIPDESLNKVDLSSNGKVTDLLSNAKESQKVAMFEALHYQPFQINENECIGENDRSLSLFVNGEQFEVDKELVVSAGGRSVFYCPRDSESSQIGNVTCKGKKVDADMFRAHLSEAKRPNAAKAAADSAKKVAEHALGFNDLKPGAKK